MPRRRLEVGPDIVAPTRDDPFVAACSEVAGGPLGGHARPGGSWWTPMRVLLAVTCLTIGIGWLAKSPCRADAWPPRTDRAVWLHQCYSDLPYLYRERGLVSGAIPYLDSGDYPAMEYPVLTGAAFGVVAWVARATLAPDGTQDDPDQGAVRFYDLMALGALVAALAIVAATARTVPWRPYDAGLVAAAPVLALTATINADLLAVLLATLAVLAWARDRPALTGVLLGLGAAAKLYPVLLLGPILVLCLRERRLRDALVAAAAAAVGWLAVDVPVWLAAPDGFAAFWRFNTERAADFRSFWYALAIRGRGVAPALLGEVAILLFAGACVVIAVLALRAPVVPRFAQLAFLVVAAFCLCNKVNSPQYALWLLPLAALARPRWRDLLIWQVGEVAHFVAVWLYLDGLAHPDSAFVDTSGYAAVVWLRVACLSWLVVVVARDVVRPEYDPVRTRAADSRAPAVAPVPAAVTGGP